MYGAQPGYRFNVDTQEYMFAANQVSQGNKFDSLLYYINNYR